MAKPTMAEFKEKYRNIYDAVFAEGVASERRNISQRPQRIASQLRSLGMDTQNEKTFTDEARAESLWATDAELRAEFQNDKDSWLAYCKAEAAGQVRILRGRVRS